MNTIYVPIWDLKLRDFSELDVGRAKIHKAENVNLIPKELKDIWQYHKFGYYIEIILDENEKPRDVFDRVQILFKLFQEGWITFRDYVAAGGKPVPIPLYYIYWGRPNRESYIISPQNQSVFCEFWRKFEKINHRDFAVSRFHLADFRPLMNDRFVDYVMAMEYLLVPDSGEGEISFKFRVTGALILGKDKNLEQKKEIMRELRNFYNLRSRTVHGENVDKIVKPKEYKTSEEAWERQIKPVRCYTRDLIKFFYQKGALNSNKGRKQIIEELLLDQNTNDAR